MVVEHQVVLMELMHMVQEVVVLDKLGQERLQLLMERGQQQLVLAVQLLQKKMYQEIMVVIVVLLFRVVQ